MHHKKIFLLSSFCNPSLQNIVGSSSAISRININHHIKKSRSILASTRLLYTQRNMSDSTNNTTTDIIRQQKQVLRKQIRSRIRSVYPSPSTSSSKSNDTTIAASKQTTLTTQSNKVFTKLFQLPQYQAASTIGFFLSMPHGEIQTRDAIQRMVCEDGKTLYVPRVGLDFELCDMDLVRCDDESDETSLKEEGGKLFYDKWPTNKWGIPEPPPSNTNIATPGDIDLLIVPGLAFDGNLHRLGQGKGYYDRFIAKMTADVDKKKLLLVGVCLDEQFLEEDTIPISDHDFVMDMVLTPSHSI